MASDNTEGGDGLTGVGYEQKFANGHDADYEDDYDACLLEAGMTQALCEARFRNDRHKDPNQYTDYNGNLVTPVPTDHKQVCTHSNSSLYSHACRPAYWN